MTATAGSADRLGTGAVHVRVPATSANIGPGFDALGLALNLHDQLTARVTSGGLEVEVSGEGSDIPRDENHLVVRAMRAAFDHLGGQPPGLALQCVNYIPQGRGLGSSAAAIVAGLLLARALVIDGADYFPEGQVLALAAALEGHPDNVAACLLGGLTIAWTSGDQASAARRPCTDEVMPVLLVAPFPAATHTARGLLPERVPHADAAANAARAALLVAGLTGDPAGVLLVATEDRLHQPYRAPAMPQTAELVALLRRAGLAAVVSGAGPSVLVLAHGSAEAGRAADAPPAGWRPHVLTVDQGGAHVTGEGAS
jgi:homoserine kinase